MAAVDPKITQNGHVPNSDVDQHFAYFRWLYDNANQNWYVQKVKDTYGATKQSFGLEPLLSPIEERVAQASNAGYQYAAPLYTNYLYPKTDYILHSYLIPGIEGSKQALEKSKNTASAGGTMSLSLAVIGTQVSLIASAAVTALFLDGIILTKNVGLSAAEKSVALEKSIEQRIYRTIDRTRNFAKIPVEKVNEFSNSFLDIINAVLDNYLHLPIEEDSDTPETSHLGRRVTRLARRVLHALKTRANDDLIQPAQQQFHNLVEQLRKSLILVDVLKQQRSQLSANMHGFKAKLSPSQLSESMSELWTKVETEAREYRVSPEEALINSIRRCSYVLNDYLKKLRQQTSEILPAPTVQRLDSATAYIEELNSTLENSKDIYGVKDEVVQKAKQKLDEIKNWTSDLISRTKNGGDSVATTPSMNSLNGSTAQNLDPDLDAYSQNSSITSEH